MQLKSIKKSNDRINLRYTTTYYNSWNSCINIMQVVFEDFYENTKGIGHFMIAGSVVNFVPVIIEGYLHKTPDFKEEHGGIFIEGKSKLLNLDMAVTIYNQLNVVDVTVFYENNELPKEFKESDHVLDKYMDSIEINGYSVGSVINGMFLLNSSNIFTEYMHEKYGNDFSWDKATEEEKHFLSYFKNKFNKLGVSPWELPATWDECKKKCN